MESCSKNKNGRYFHPPLQYCEWKQLHPIIMKYVIFEISGREFPLLFSDAIEHEDIVREVNRPVISSGFIYQGNTQYFAHSDTPTLASNLSLRDTDIINRWFENRVK